MTILTPAPRRGEVRIAKIPARHTAYTLRHTLRFLKDHPRHRVRPDVWTAEPMDLAAFRRWFLRRLNEKINRNEPRRGRKDSPDWLRAAAHAARAVNTPRLIVRETQIPFEFRERLAHRLTSWEDEEW